MIEKLSMRKLRLLGCACWRQIFPFMVGYVDEQELLEWESLCNQIEYFVDSKISKRDLYECFNRLRLSRFNHLKDKVVDVHDLSLPLMINNQSDLIQRLLSFFSVTSKYKDVQAELIEDIDNNLDHHTCSLCHGTGETHIPDEPFIHRMIPRRETCRVCRGTGRYDIRWIYKDYFTDQIKSIAQKAYDELPNSTGLLILADALEDIQCPQHLLDHLRSSKPHIKGCSVIDLILDKG